MPTDFDKAFADAKARSDSAASVGRDVEQEFLRRQNLARLIAAPYLREIALDVRRTLLALDVPIEEQSIGELARIHTVKVNIRRRFWNLTGDFSGVGRLYLTEDACFSKDLRLSSLDGFEAIMRDVNIIDIDYEHEGRYWSIREGSAGRSGIYFYVDSKSRDVFLVDFQRDAPPSVKPLAEWLAEQVLRLQRLNS